MTKQDTPQTNDKPAAGETEWAYLRKQVSLLREVFFPYDLVETVQENMEVMRTRENGASEGGILKLLGPSRSGKTKIIRDYARRFPIVEKGIQGKDGEFSDHMPVVCMRVPDTNAKNLLERLVATLSRRSMEDIKTRGFRRFDLQEDVMKLARDVGLQLLCLEETHDAIESHGDKAAKVTAGVLKDLTNESCFSLVVSGTEAAQRLFDLSGELEGRVVFDHPLVPFQWDDIGERTSFLEILGELDEHLARNVFGKKSGLTGSAIAKPLLLASRGWIGHAATLLESAATKAVDAGAHKVALVHFVQAFGVSPLRRYVPDPFLSSKVPQAPLMTADVSTAMRGRTRQTGRDAMFKR